MSFRPRSEPALREVLYAAAVRPRLTGRYRPATDTARSAKQSFADVDADTAPANSGWFDIRIQAEEVYGIKLLL
jgi:hypothetical protein